MSGKRSSTYDYIIIGGGIAGLYAAYKLLQREPKASIFLCEKNHVLGGRISTYSDQYMTVEEGAGRFHQNHRYLLTLIEELGLSKRMVPISSDAVYIDINYDLAKKQDLIRHSGVGKSIITSKLAILIGELYAYSQLYSRSYLIGVSLSEFAGWFLKELDVKYILGAFGYYSELVIMNAYDALQLIIFQLNPSLQYYSLRGGMSQIIVKIADRLKKKHIRIVVDTEITSIDFRDELFYCDFVRGGNGGGSGRGNIVGKTCICALPKEALIRFGCFHDIKGLLKSVESSPLCRIYCAFREPFGKNLRKMTTNNKLRMIIPINHHTVMISYSDNKYARYWKRIYDAGGYDLVDVTLAKYVKQTTGLDMPEPLVTRMFYWDAGVGYWGIGADSAKVAHGVLQPFVDRRLFICGENYAEKNQQWIEGALETVENMMDKL